ncbi:hypothetical protein [Prosthecobacter dejongeii]|uniref:Uncharacterized protein n=1 Tax=Prosthecobacter dejongeii TaxID=48465 RepID=A0A7W7YL56_9BACT|nr:hypothetical protein [Prosthecobacter dejongeii]MBB5038246.1 hypothetical protein [Prosthecobacter dejongeii]
MEYTSYADWQRAVDQKIAEVWALNGGGLAFDPVNPEMGISHVMHDDDSLEVEIREARVRTFQELMDFIWAGGPNPVAALKRLFVITRCGSPQHLAFMSQTDVAVLLNETRAATQSREEKHWEKYLEELGFFGTRTRLKKNDGARETYKELRKGNVSRLGGKAALKKFSVLRQKHGTPKKTTTQKAKRK